MADEGLTDAKVFGWAGRVIIAGILATGVGALTKNPEAWGAITFAAFWILRWVLLYLGTMSAPTWRVELPPETPLWTSKPGRIIPPTGTGTERMHKP